MIASNGEVLALIEDLTMCECGSVEHLLLQLHGLEGNSNSPAFFRSNATLLAGSERSIVFFIIFVKATAALGAARIFVAMVAAHVTLPTINHHSSLLAREHLGWLGPLWLLGWLHACKVVATTGCAAKATGTKISEAKAKSGIFLVCFAIQAKYINKSARIAAYLTRRKRFTRLFCARQLPCAALILISFFVHIALADHEPPLHRHTVHTTVLRAA